MRTFQFRAAAALLALALFCGCASGAAAGPQRYDETYFDCFDTVTTLIGYVGSRADFDAAAREIHAGLERCHRLFDIYHTYEGLNNLKTVNDSAGGAPVAVDAEIVELLLFCRELYGRTGGAVDVTLGPVLALWHEAREQGLADPARAALPDPDALAEAAKHTGIGLLEINAAASTVRLTDPAARLDVGAVAKGWAAERVCAAAPSGYLLNLGGNVRATGPKPDGSPWVVGIQDPDGGASDYLRTVSVSAGAVVNSGDYQRYYVVDGLRYAHIIDPETLYPAVRWRAVAIRCGDSGLADGLSTALFVLDRETGAALAASCGAEALWVAPDGTIVTTEGFETA